MKPIYVTFFRRAKWCKVAASFLLLGGLAGDICSEQVNATGKPPGLTLIPPLQNVPGLVRWFGNPLERTPQVDSALWVKDGSKMYVKSDEQQMRLQVWEHQVRDGLPAMSLKGYLPLKDVWSASYDGRWVFGEITSDNESRLGMFKGDDYDGVWSLDRNAISWVKQTTFTLDGEFLLVTGPVTGGIQLKVFEAATGKLAHHIQKRHSGGEDVSLFVAGGEGEVFLPPAFDDEERITKLNTKTWKIEPVSEGMSDWSRIYLRLSVDGRWLVPWHNNRYQVLERSEKGFVKRFEGNAEVDYSDFSGRQIRGIRNLRISPNGQQLVVSGGGIHKIIGLNNQKVLHESATGCMCGVFAPDGTTFWQTCHPFRPVDPQSWELRREQPSSPRIAVNQVAFSPNGKRLALRAGCDIDIWDLDGRSPIYKLISSRAATLGKFAWKDDATVYGGDRAEFLQWHLPDQRDGEVVKVIGTKLFDTFASLKTAQTGEPWFAHSQSITIDAKSGQCLLSMNDHRDNNELRNPTNPGVVRRFNLNEDAPSPTDLAFFSKNSEEIYYPGNPNQGDGKLFAYDLKTEVLRSSEGRYQGNVYGFDEERGRIILLSIGSGNSPVTVVDMATFETVTSLFPPLGWGWNWPASVSRDGRWLACLINKNQSQEAQRHGVLLIDLQEKKVAALVKDLDSKVEKFAFSADSKMLAAGFNNGIVGLWSVEKLIKEATVPEEMILGDGKMLVEPASIRGPRPADRLLKAWGLESFTRQVFELKNGDRWEVSADGTIKAEAAKLEIGKLMINGTAVTALGQRWKDIERSKNSRDFRTTLRVGKGEAPTDLKVQRVMHGTNEGRVTWIDVLENAGTEAVTVKLSFIAAMGGEWANLRVGGKENTDQAPTMLGDGALSLPVDGLSLSVLAEHGGKQRFLGWIFCNDGAKQRPSMRWDAEHQAVVAEWTIRIEPMGRSQWVHQFSQSQPAVGEPEWRMREELVKSQVNVRQMMKRMGTLVNFGVSAEERDSLDSMVTGINLDAYERMTDSLGFRWLPQPVATDGLESELGAERLLGLWLDGEPASFVSQTQRGSFMPGSEGTLKNMLDATPLKAEWKVERRSYWFKDQAAYATQDTVINPSKEDVTAKVELLVLGKKGILEVQGADGKKLDLSKPLVLSEGVGRLIAILEGEERPAILLAGTAGMGPATLRLQAGRGLFVGYELMLKPQERKVLTHAVAPRPLAAFGGVEAAAMTWDAVKVLKVFDGVMRPEAGR